MVSRMEHALCASTSLSFCCSTTDSASEIVIDGSHKDIRDQAKYLNYDEGMDNQQYGKLEYWDDRYKHEAHFEWCQDFSKFKDFFLQAVPDKNSRILILGCGNSALGVDLVNHGYKNVINSDYSEVVIEMMRKTHPSLHWDVADISKLTERYTEESFDVVLEKATLDSFFVDEKDPWHYSSRLLTQMEAIIDQVSKILSPTGMFISLSFTQPHFRKPIYAKDRFNWGFEYTTYGDFFHYFFYIMKKGEILPSDVNKEKVNGGLNLNEVMEPLSEDEDDFIFAIQSV